LSALRAGDRDFDSLARAGCLRRRDGCQPFVLRMLARLTSLRRILQPLVVIENLLACRPDELLAAVNALDFLVLKFSRMVLRENFVG